MTTTGTAPMITKTRRLELLGGAIDGASAALDELERLSNSPKPDEARHATALLIVERNEVDDLKAIRAFLRDKDAKTLKPLSAEDVNNLTALEDAIDKRMQASNLVNAGIAIASEVLRTSEAVGQILSEA